MSGRMVCIALFWAALLVAAPVAADPGLAAIKMTATADGGATYSVSLQVLIAMTMLTVLPALVLSMTSFTRIIIVLSILRQALGTAQTPPNQVLIGLALFLTIFVMSPVFERINKESVQPFLNDGLPAEQAIERAEVPLRQFMLPHTREQDLTLFAGLAGSADIQSPEARALLAAGAGLSHQRTQDRVPDGIPDLPAVSDHRYRGGRRADVDGYDDALPYDHLFTVQADAVRAHRRLGARHWNLGVQFRVILHVLCGSIFFERNMSPELVLTVGKQALYVTVLLSAPLLLTALALGLLVSLFQAATQINETSLSFIPKLLGLVAIIYIAGPWMLTLITDYAKDLFASIPSLIG